MITAPMAALRWTAISGVSSIALFEKCRHSQNLTEIQGHRFAAHLVFIDLGPA
jgi:hypothetical protein